MVANEDVNFEKVVDTNIPTCPLPRLAQRIVAEALGNANNLTIESVFTDIIGRMDPSGAAFAIPQALMDPSLSALTLNTLAGNISGHSFRVSGTLGTALNLPHVVRALGGVEGTLFAVRLIDNRRSVVKLADSSQGLGNLLEGVRKEGGSTSFFVGGLTRATWLSHSQLEILRGTGTIPRLFSKESLADVGYSQFYADPAVLVNLMTPPQLDLYKGAVGVLPSGSDAATAVNSGTVAGPPSGAGVAAVSSAPHKSDNQFIWEEWVKHSAYTYKDYSALIISITKKLRAKRLQEAPPASAPPPKLTPEQLVDEENKVAQEVVDFIRSVGCATARVFPDTGSLLDHVSNFVLGPNRSKTVNIATRDARMSRNFADEIYDLFKMAAFHGLYPPVGSAIGDILLAETGMDAAVIGGTQGDVNALLALNPHIFISSPNFTPHRYRDEPPRDDWGKYRTVLDSRINALLARLRTVAPFQTSTQTYTTDRQSAVDIWGKIYAERQKGKKAKGGRKPVAGKEPPNPWAWVGRQTPAQVDQDRPYLKWQADRYFLNYVGGRQQFTRPYFFRRVLPAIDDPVARYCLMSEIQYLISIYYSNNAPSPEILDITSVIGDAVSVLSVVTHPFFVGRLSAVVQKILASPEFSPRTADVNAGILADPGEAARNLAAAETPGVVKREPGKPPRIMGNRKIELRIRAALHLQLWPEFLQNANKWLVGHLTFLSTPEEKIKKNDRDDHFKMFMRALCQDKIIFEAITADMPLRIQLAFFYRSHGFPVPPEVADWVPESWLELGVTGLIVPKREAVKNLAEVLDRASGGKTRLGGGKCHVGVDVFDESLADVLDELECIRYETPSAGQKGRFMLAGVSGDGHGATTPVAGVPDAEAVIIRDPRTGGLRRIHKHIWFEFKRGSKTRASNPVYNKAALIGLRAKRSEVASRNPAGLTATGTQISTPAILDSEGDARAQLVSNARNTYRLIDRQLLKSLTNDFAGFCLFVYRGFVGSSFISSVAGGEDIGDATWGEVSTRALGLRNACDRYGDGKSPNTLLGTKLNHLAIRVRVQKIYDLLRKRYPAVRDGVLSGDDVLRKARVVGFLKRSGLLGYLYLPQPSAFLVGESCPISGGQGDTGGLPWETFPNDVDAIAQDLRNSPEYDQLKTLLGSGPTFRPITPVGGTGGGTSDREFCLDLIEMTLKGLVLFHEERLQTIRSEARLIEGSNDNVIAARERKRLATMLHLAYACEMLRVRPLTREGTTDKVKNLFEILLDAPLLLPASGFIDSMAKAISRVFLKDTAMAYLKTDPIKVGGDGAEYDGISLLKLEAPPRPCKNYFKKFYTKYSSAVGELVSVLGTMQVALGDIPSKGTDPATDPRKGDLRQRFIQDMKKTWQGRMENKLRQQGFTIDDKGSGGSSAPIKVLLSELIARLGLTSGDIERIDLTADLEFRPVPFHFSNNRPTLGPIEIFPAIYRRIARDGEDAIKFSIIDRPLNREALDKYDPLFTGILPQNLPAGFHYLRDETDGGHAPRGKNGKYKKEFYNVNPQLSGQITSSLRLIGGLLKEMHATRKYARPVRLAYKQLEIWYRRQTIVCDYLTQRLNDKIWRGLGKATTPLNTALKRHFQKLNKILGQKGVPLIIYDEKEITDLCQWVSTNIVTPDNAPVISFPYATDGPVGKEMSQNDMDNLNKWALAKKRPKIFATVKQTSMDDLVQLGRDFLKLGQNALGNDENEQGIKTLDDFYFLLCNELYRREGETAEKVGLPNPSGLPQAQADQTNGKQQDPLKKLLSSIPGLGQMSQIPGVGEFLGLSPPGGQQPEGPDLIQVLGKIGKVPGLLPYLRSRPNSTPPISNLAEFHAVFLLMSCIVKAPHLSTKLVKASMGKKLVQVEHKNVEASIQSIHYARVNPAFTRLQKIFIAVFNAGANFDLPRLMRETKRRLGDLASRVTALADAKREAQGQLKTYLRLNRRGPLVSQDKASEARTSKAMRRGMRALAHEFMQGHTGNRWNCPHYHAKIIDGLAEIKEEIEEPKAISEIEAQEPVEPKIFPLPMKAFLSPVLLRRIRQGNKGGTQHGATIAGLTIFPPVTASNHVSANVFLRSIPDTDDSYAEPWFATLAAVVKVEGGNLKENARGVDINQLNCGRTYAHGIVGPAPAFKDFDLEARHVPAQDITILAGLYCFGVQDWEKKAQKEQVARVEMGEEENAGNKATVRKWHPRLTGFNRYYGNVDGGPSFSRSALWTSQEDQEQASNNGLVKEIVPAFIFFGRVRKDMIDSNNTPFAWNPEDSVFACDVGNSVLRMPKAEFPYNDLPFISDESIQGLPLDIRSEVVNDHRAPTFNDELNSVPFYFAQKWSHGGVHLSILRGLLNRKVKVKGSILAPFLTSGQELRSWREASMRTKRAHCLWNEFQSISARQFSLRGWILVYLARCDSYLSLRFPTGFTAHEGLTFAAKGLTGGLGKAVQGMPKDFKPVAALSGRQFRRDKLSKQLPVYKAVPAKATSLKCSSHRGTDRDPPIRDILVGQVNTLNSVLQGAGKALVQLTDEELKGLLPLPGEIDRVSSADWAVDDIFGEVVDCHVNASKNIARIILEKK